MTAVVAEDSGLVTADSIESISKEEELELAKRLPDTINQRTLIKRFGLDYFESEKQKRKFEFYEKDFSSTDLEDILVNAYQQANSVNEAIRRILPYARKLGKRK